MASSHVALISAGGTNNRRIASSAYGYCTTGASTVAKTVSLYTGNSTTTDGTWSSSDLFHGLTITVRFQYSNTATNPTLNVNSSGAKRIYKYGTTSPGNTASTSWQANSVISLTYDTLLNASGCWVMNDHLDDTTGGGGSVTYTLSGSGDDDEYTITATPTTGTATSATIPAATQTDAGVMQATDKAKLDGIASGAEVNVQSDWNQSNSTEDDYIKNKPTVPSFNDIYPVGSIYMSVNNTNPGTLFGGTWTQIQDTFLLAAGTTYTAGATGGSADAIVPYHNHSVSQITDGAASKTLTGTMTFRGYQRSDGTNYASNTAASGVFSRASSGTSNTTKGGSNVSGNADTVVTATLTHAHNISAHNTNYEGTSEVGANMPPYLVVYVWQRTA